MELRGKRAPGIGAYGSGSVSVGGDTHGPVLTNPTFGATAVPLIIAVKDSRSVFSDVKVEEFTGRQWLIDRIDSALAQKPSGYVWIEAEAGLGKTALAAHLVHSRGYVAHFARQSQGGSARAALLNLAGQLVKGYGLDAFAPGGMLPSWVHEPDGFEIVLSKAAEICQAAGKQLVMVVDGADEAEAPEGGLPWGLPSLLPYGVHIIGTYRTGSPPAFSASPSEVLRLDKNDQRNYQDLRAYISRAIRDEAIAAPFAKSGMSPEQAPELLISQTGGVWVYLRYILSELRTGQRTPENLASLPADLTSYYGELIRRWRNESDWISVGRSLLGGLVAAREPLEYDKLARLSRLNSDTPDVRRWCDLLFRPVLTADANRAYQLYHASARSFFGGEVPEHIEADHLRALASDLKKNTVVAHEHIVRYYIDCFGRLDVLPKLATNPKLAESDDGYALRHLTTHLLSANLPEALHKLLAANYFTQSSDRLNVWFTAHEEAGTLDLYLDDVEHARKEAESRVDSIVRKDALPGVAFIDEVRCLLLKAAAHSLTDSVGHKLLHELVKRGVWDVRRGVAHARRLTEPEERYKALLAVHAFAAQEEKDALAEEALSAVRIIAPEVYVGIEEGVWVDSPALVLPYLREEVRDEVIAEVLGREEVCVEEITLILPFIPEDRRLNAVQTALTSLYQERERYFSTEAHIARILNLRQWVSNEEESSRLLSMAISAQRGRTSELVLLARHVTGRERESFINQALQSARRSRSDLVASDLVEILPLLSTEQRANVAREALSTASQMNEPYWRTRSLSLLLPYVGETERTALVEKIYNDVAVADHYTIARLAPYLSPSELSEALHAARRSAFGGRLALATNLLENFPCDRRNILAEMLVGLAKTPESRARCSVAIMRYTLEEGKDTAEEVLECISSIPNPYSREGLLSQFFSYLPEKLRRTFASQVAAELTKSGMALPQELIPYVALNASSATLEGILTAQRNSPNLGSEIAALLPFLPKNLAHRALQMAYQEVERTDWAVSFIEVIPQITEQLVEPALEMARSIRYSGARASAIAALVPLAGESDRETLILESIEAAKKSGWQDDATRLFEDLLAPTQEELAEAIGRVWHMRSEMARLQAVTSLLPQMTDKPKSEFLSKALEILEKKPSYSRRDQIPLLVPHLPKGLIDKAVSIAPKTTEAAISILTRVADSDEFCAAERIEVFRNVVPRHSLSDLLNSLIESFTPLLVIAGDDTKEHIAEMVIEIVTCWPE